VLPPNKKGIVSDAAPSLLEIINDYIFLVFSHALDFFVIVLNPAHSVVVHRTGFCLFFLHFAGIAFAALETNMNILTIF